MRSNEGPVAAGCRLLDESDAVVLPIQGPPGAGKTYTAAAMILHALKSGKRVGITAPSHKVIATILEKVCSAADQAGFLLKGIQKGDESQQCASSQIVATKDNAKVLEALQNGDAQLAAGTAWLWARDDMIDSVDVLFVDEAGQFSLANAMAIAPATKNLVLLGDPQQLDQPQKGVHPPGAAASVLQHLIGVDATVSADRGLFLDMTWRLHPDVCQFTSEMFYDGRLAPRAGLERQAVTGGGAMGGTGLRLIPVQHVGNVDESPEEVEVIMKLVGKLLGERRSWINSEGAEARLELKDILIIAPYNVQVASLATRLPTGARVGTVDKFQGQEAPIVIYSLTSSSAEDAPRGMGFLYNSNRLNVATSRARCLAVLVASPQLFVPDCRTPEQMRLANAFCRFLEMAPGQ